MISIVVTFTIDSNFSTSLVYVILFYQSFYNFKIPITSNAKLTQVFMDLVAIFLVQPFIPQLTI